MNLILVLLTIMAKWYIWISIATMLLTKAVMTIYERSMRNGMLNRYGVDEDEQTQVMDYMSKTFGGLRIIRAAIQWPSVLSPLMKGFIIAIKNMIN